MLDAFRLFSILIMLIIIASWAVTTSNERRIHEFIKRDIQRGGNL